MINDANPPGYERDIRPLFRESDRESMEFAFDLWNYHDVRTYAKDIIARLAEGSMPCDGEWPEEQIALFRRWLAAGMPA
jgi:hypothetical protein